MLSALVNKPNRVLEKQKLLQNDHRPLWYRMPRSRAYLSVYYTLFTVGMVGTTYGMITLIKGKPSSK